MFALTVRGAYLGRDGPLSAGIIDHLEGKKVPNLTQMGKDQSITVSIKQLVKVDLNQTHHCQSLSFDNSGPFGLASVNQILS